MLHLAIVGEVKPASMENVYVKKKRVIAASVLCALKDLRVNMRMEHRGIVHKNLAMEHVTALQDKRVLMVSVYSILTKA